MILERISVAILPCIILIILTVALFKKVPIYEEFIEGAKDGFKVSVSIIPYLVALIVAISMFRASGALDWFASFFVGFIEKLSLSADIIPVMLTRSLSGSATLGLFSEIATEHGAESFITKTAAIMVGSSETTFYVLSVYFGAVGIKKFRYAIPVGLIADFIGIVLAIWVARLFFLANIV
ncbi:MAG: spore maturation protein [Cyanobacteria bacterium SIG28]|nr:spore maturation protein [Cyanobacteria bacterium SIG28]